VNDVRHARILAGTMLAAELPRRWRHVRGVAARATSLDVRGAATRSLLVSAAWLHDVGYASPLVETGFHPIDGARHLRRMAADEALVNLVAHHSCASFEASLRGLADVLAEEFPRDDSLPHDELCFCDQTTGPDGDPVTVTDRLAEIRQRYPDGHVVRRFVDAAEPTLIAIVYGVEARYGLAPSLPRPTASPPAGAPAPPLPG
jgi:HD domain